MSRTRVFLSSPSPFVNSTLKSIGLTSNNESKPLKSFYLANDTSTCENLKFEIKFVWIQVVKKLPKNKCIKINLETF